MTVVLIQTESYTGVPLLEKRIDVGTSKKLEFVVGLFNLL
jgi:hypothetical protein